MTSDIIVLGSGGHAKVCIELLVAMGETVAFCVSDPTCTNQHCLNVPILKGDEQLSRLRTEGYHKLFIAIGANNRRAQLADFAQLLGYELVNAISPYAMISPSATIGVGIAIMPGAIINATATIKDLAIINTGATIDHDCIIARSAHIAPQCALAGNVSIGAQSFLGIGCKVIPNITIGEQVTIGAGAVVTHHIQSGATAVGIPAQIIKI